MLLERHLDALATQALTEALGLPEPAPAMLRKAQDPKFGDYQVNGAMPLAKKLGKNPREIAQLIADALASHEAFHSTEVAGPGFVNLRVRDTWLAARLTEMLRDEARDGVPAVDAPERIVVDFSGPNIAKQMHVGHLRSTIIGHALVRLLRFTGHHVIGDNHLGDWGTQFGLLIMGMREWGNQDDLVSNPIVELERVYKLASARAKEDAAFEEKARHELAKLQTGDPDNTALWERFVAATRTALDEVYAELGVTFDEWLGESAYHDMLPGVVATLREKGLAREDQGAICIFFGELDGAPADLKKQKEPFIIQKSDGAFLYSTTDLATLVYRRDRFAADRSIYVVDARQALHFKQLFAVAKLLGMPMKLEHVGFGTVLGPDGKAIKTRDGKAITLSSLLAEAKTRAEMRIREAMSEGKLHVDEAHVGEVARVVGIGAVKYADLMQNRLTDYQFDWDKMISFHGNAGPYLQYAYARSRAIFRKGGVDPEALDREATVRIDDPHEAALARQLARFGDVIHKAAESYQPHVLCDHLFELSGAFNAFYHSCKVLEAKDAETRESRLALVSLTARHVRRGLSLLGIDVVERM
ncbi:MAG: arginine--tRNA ligase [Polyangiales bacterium]